MFIWVVLVSPSIAAATEKLRVLNATEDVGPSSHLMEAQRKRFEELKVCVCVWVGEGGQKWIHCHSDHFRTEPQLRMALLVQEHQSFLIRAQPLRPRCC